MHPLLLRVYHALPPPLWSAAATLHGARLRRTRYGGAFRDALRGFAERDGWDRARWAAYQARELRALLERAVARVPYYRELYRRGAFPIEAVRGPGDLGALPLLPKEAVRSRPRDLLADDREPRRMVEEHTSGTTGTPLSLWWSERTAQTWYACFEQRARRWNGVTVDDRWAILGGQLVVPTSRRKPPFWAWNAAGSQLYLSVHHLAPEFLDAYLDELRRRRVVYLFGYASALDALATHALERGRTDVRVRLAISNAEPFYEDQRRRIERAFACVTRDTYGAAEIAGAAFECAEGRLHVAPDVGVLEILRDDGSPAAPGELGDVVVTGLLNRDHVLVRYRQGDRAALAPPDEMCPCGRQMPLVQRLEGRADDVLVTPDGRRIGRLDPVFKATLAIREAQIAQTARDRVEVRVVPGAGYGEHDAEAIRARLAERLGPGMRVAVVVVERIPRTARGKFRAVVNEVDHP